VLSVADLVGVDGEICLGDFFGDCVDPDGKEVSKNGSLEGGFDGLVDGKGEMQSVLSLSWFTFAFVDLDEVDDVDEFEPSMR